MLKKAVRWLNGSLEIGGVFCAPRGHKAFILFYGFLGVLDRFELSTSTS